MSQPVSVAELVCMLVSSFLFARLSAYRERKCIIWVVCGSLGCRDGMRVAWWFHTVAE